MARGPGSYKKGTTGRWKRKARDEGVAGRLGDAHREHMNGLGGGAGLGWSGLVAGGGGWMVGCGWWQVDGGGGWLVVGSRWWWVLGGGGW